MAYDVIGIGGLDGRVSCGYPEAVVGVDVSDRTWFLEVTETNDLTVGGYQISRATGEPNLVVARPVEANGRPKAYVGAAIGLDYLTNYLAREDSGHLGDMVVIDAAGRTIVSSISGVTFGETIKWPSQEGLASMTLAGKQREVFVRSAIVGNTHFDIMAVAPLANGLTVPEKLGLGLFIFTLSFGLATTVFGYRYLHRNVIEPIESLRLMAPRVVECKAERLAQNPAAPLEVQQALSSFNAMAEKLTSTLTELDVASGLAGFGTWRFWPGENKFWLSHHIVEIMSFQDNFIPISALEERILPSDLPTFQDALQRAAVGRDLVEIEFRAKNGEGALLIFRAQTGVLGAKSVNNAMEVTGIVQDITELRSLGSQLQQAQKLEAVGHLTGGVAHDFNNLLTVILGSAEQITEMTTDPKLRHMAETTMAAAERGAELTGRLLAFARRKPLDPKPTDLNQLIKEMRKLIRQTLPESIDLEFVFAPDLGIAEIDAGELDAALLNLVVNAHDAMEENDKLMIETANVVLDRAYANRHAEVEPGEYVMICVSDTGSGMDPETVQRAFEPFFTTKDVGKGSGLGLSMVFGFAKQSGGHIKIYSEPGEGTLVKLYFPRVHTAQETDFKPSIDFSLQGGTENILIAEDDELVLEHLKNQLLSLGYQATTARSGPEALEAVQTRDDIDLLMTDVVMPGGMNGRELAEQALAARPSLRVLFTSGYTENTFVHHCRLDPGVALLSKPYTRLELATKLRRVLDDEPQKGGGRI
jgi:signal transduction histidine kinase/ActR/RegA family two-component response regulator